MRWRKSQDNLDELVKLQAELLDAAVSFVKPGGLLVYSTCSVEPEENEMQVEAFLERHPVRHSVSLRLFCLCSVFERSIRCKDK